MSNLIYEASIYTRAIDYRNFRGEEKTVDLHFALDPLRLMQLVAEIKPKKIKSGNPAINGQDAEISEAEQLGLIRKLAKEAAGYSSNDGESWIPFEGFEESIVGKAFLVKLAASDGDRREFAEKVLLAPFKAFVEYAKADETNTPADVQQFDVMLKQMDNIFKVPDPAAETPEAKRARLQAEMAALGMEGQTSQMPPAE